MSDEHVAWDDARLEAAFARFATSAPSAPGLAEATIAMLRPPFAGERMPSRRRISVSAIGGLTAALLLIIAVVAWPRLSTAPAGQAVTVADLPISSRFRLADVLAREPIAIPDRFAPSGLEALDQRFGRTWRIAAIPAIGILLGIAMLVGVAIIQVLNELL